MWYAFAALNLHPNSRFARVLSALAVVAVIALTGGVLTATGGATPGLHQGTLLVDAGRWDHPFLRAEPTDVAKGALRDRRDGKTPIGKKFEALFSAHPPASAHLIALATAPAPRGFLPPLWSLAARAPRGPPAT